jgi:hypothetical protein
MLKLAKGTSVKQALCQHTPPEADDPRFRGSNQSEAFRAAWKKLGPSRAAWNRSGPLWTLPNSPDQLRAAESRSKNLWTVPGTENPA